MTSILKLILGALLKFVWARAEKWYQQELTYQRNKKILINEVKDVARKMAETGDNVRIERESIDDSFLRLERISIKREPVAPRINGPIFGDAYRRGEEGNRSGDSLDLPEVPEAGAGGGAGAAEAE